MTARGPTARGPGTKTSRGLRHAGAGRLTLNGSRYLLIRPETLVGVQKAMERALGAGAAACLVAGGQAGGARATRTLQGAAPERVRRLSAVGTRIGWGAFRVERVTASDFTITVRHSPFAEAYGRARRPVCHLIRGVLEALGATTLPIRRVVVETACAATGARVCRFETRPLRSRRAR